MKSRKVIVFALMLAVLLALLTSCAPGDGTNTPNNVAGFFSGIWHGWIAPITLIISIFDKNISIYEVNNVGFWYDLGFYMAVISGFGGLALSRRKKCRDRNDG